VSEPLSQMSAALRARRYSRRTEQAYRLRVRRFIRFHGIRHPADMAAPEINAFLTHLAVDEQVSASPQTQALCALFLCHQVMGREVGELTGLVRARTPRRLPVVITRDEVKAVLSELGCDLWLMASLMYGAGLRLMERLRPRVLDLELRRGASCPPARPRRRLGPRRAAGGPRAQVPGRPVRLAPATGLPAAPPASSSTPAAAPCATPSRPTPSRRATASASSRSCSVTRTSVRP